MPVAAHIETHATTESSSSDQKGESSTLVLSGSSGISDCLLTLVEIARQIEQDESKHVAVLAKIKRLVAHESVRELLGGVRAGGKGFRYPEDAVQKMQYLVTNPLVSAANADEYLRTLEKEHIPNRSVLTRTCESSLFDQRGESPTFDLRTVAEIVSAAIRQSGESSMSVLLPLMERITGALETQSPDRAVTKAEAAALMGIAEGSVNRHLPALTPNHVSYLHIQMWLAARRTAAEQRRTNRRGR